ncbi:A coat protein [Xanthomonas sp. XNM01]|uniref:A coat protein n=1 Tax=Xanthomonas sp. XNM01 TaxID=2769289 RepID=UPI00177DAD7E|nr:A coat protein [Xanthomonas sp. XNM01]MBD9368359.1 A coat protein [Xanthomonas sp. XNM01]
MIARLCIALIMLACWLVPFRTSYAATDGCPDKAPYCDQGEAMMSCQGRLAAVVPPTPPWEWKDQPECVHLTSSRRYHCKASIRHPNTGNIVDRFCGYHYYADDCTKRNATYPPGDMQPGLAQPPSECYGGCRLVGRQVTAQTGGITIYGVVDRSYTGEVCSVRNDSNAPIDANRDKKKETEPKTPECTALGSGQTACMRPDGNYCATASTGKTFCWAPDEEGAKTDGEHAQRKSEKDRPVLPPDVKIPDKDWQRTEGHQVTHCTHSGCKTSNVTNYTTVAAGTSKNSTGNNKADGSGNSSGNGTGTGAGGKAGEEGKDSATESGNCETPPVCTGDTLKCLQLKITWRIDCNTKGNEITDSESCGAGDVPVCAGKSCKAEEYSLLLRDWRRRCELKADAQAGANGGQGDDEAGVIGGLWASDGAPTPSFDTGKLSIGGGGDLIPSVEIFEGGQTFQVPQSWYSVLSVIKTIVIASAMVAAFWILARL